LVDKGVGIALCSPLYSFQALFFPGQRRRRLFLLVVVHPENRPIKESCYADLDISRAPDPKE
jgi:hypothetical protein